MRERPEQVSRVPVPREANRAALVVELEPGVVAAERERRQAELVGGERGERLDLAAEVIGEPAEPPLAGVPEPLEAPSAASPSGDLAGPRRQERAPAQRAESRHAFEQHEPRFIPRG